MDLKVFTINSSFDKTLNFQTRRAKVVKEKTWNFVYDGNIYFYRLLTVFGLFPMVRNERGVIRFEPFSILTIYTAVLIGIGLTISIFIIPILLTNLLATDFNFEEGILYSALFSFPIVTLLPFINFFESKKMAEYLQEWDHFQNRFEATTKKTLAKPISKWVTVGLILVNLLSVCVMAWAIIPRFSTLIEEHNLDKNFHMGILVSLPYCSVVILAYACSWYFYTDALKKSANSLIADIESLNWMPKGLDDHIHLWLNLRRLCMDLGGVLTFTILYLIAVMFFVALPTLYVSAKLAMKGDYSQITAPITTLGVITVLVDLAHRATEKIGSQFEARLTKLLLSGKAAKYEKELTNFIQLVDSSSLNISLGGFLVLDRGINVPLYSSVITYLIIISQFQDEYPSNIGGTV